MTPTNCIRALAAIGAGLLSAACGGGSSGAASAAVAPPTPGAGPQLQPPVVIFPNPTPQTYASVGSSTTSAGDGYTPIGANARLTDASLDAARQPRLRYAATGSYEIQLPGQTFDALVHYKGLANPTAANNFFQPSRAPQNAATFVIGRSTLDGYLHSELASWTDATAPALAGFVAFGTPTGAAGIPTSGRATYRGRAVGIVDVTYFDGLYGGYFFSGAGGDVTLIVDFAARTVEGALELSIADGRFARSVAMATATLPPSTDAWRGLFVVADSGSNEFRVMLTGPGATELIGSWAVPIELDGVPHQLMGAWIATRSP